MDGIIYTMYHVPTMCSRSLPVLMTPSICTYGQDMAYWSACLSNIAHIGAICGYIAMFGLWNSPNHDGGNFFY